MHDKEDAVTSCGGASMFGLWKLVTRRGDGQCDVVPRAPRRPPEFRSAPTVRLSSDSLLMHSTATRTPPVPLTLKCSLCTASRYARHSLENNRLRASHSLPTGAACRIGSSRHSFTRYNQSPDFQYDPSSTDRNNTTFSNCHGRSIA